MLALLVLALGAAPDAIERIIVEGELQVEVVVGRERGVEVRGEGVSVTGPSGGLLRLSASSHGDGARPLVRVKVDGPRLTLEVKDGARVRASGERLDLLAIEAAHTSRVDTAKLPARTLTVRADHAARVRASGESVTVTATRSAQVVLVGRPKKLAQDARDAARVIVE